MLSPETGVISNFAAAATCHRRAFNHFCIFIRCERCSWGTNLKFPRRQFLQLAAGAAALPFATHVARPQSYPTRPVRVIVGFPAGGGQDIAARSEDGPTVFQYACRLGAEGIVSKRLDGTYRSGPCSAWIKVRNPASVAVQRERSENWNR